MPSGIKQDLLNRKFNRLLAIEKQIINKKIWYVCQCDCGNKSKVRADSLRSGRIKSCGCYKKDNPRQKHGESRNRSKEYAAYVNMLARCYRKNHPSYKNYGARGIFVCSSWLGENGYINFLKDMGRSPISYTLDRIDNNKSYSADNCRWASRKEQQNNMRCTTSLEIDGVNKPLSVWCDEHQIKKYVVVKRLKLNWPKELLFKKVGSINLAFREGGYR